jgi:phage gpG-like protein
MTVRKFGQWNVARATTHRMGERARRGMHKAIRQEAQLFRSMVLRAFNSRGRTNGKAWAPLKPDTKKRKGSSKPLIDTGDLRNSVAVVDLGAQVFVGVPNLARNRQGEALTSIAAVHEYGKTIAQKRGDSLVVIQIPERSFLRSTADFHFKPTHTTARVHARLGLAMGYGWADQVPKAKVLAAAGRAAAKGKK